MADVAESLRERKKRETRRLLQSTALRLAVERGVASLTVEAISEAANVAPRTFFNYFSCKEEALVGDEPGSMEKLRENIAARPADEPPLQAIHAAVSAMTTEYLTSRDDALARMRLVCDDPSLLPLHLAKFAALERVVAEAVGLRLGTDADDVRCSVLAATALAALRVAARRWAHGAVGPDGREQSLQQAIDDAFAVVTELATGPGGASATGAGS